MSIKPKAAEAAAAIESPLPAAVPALPAPAAATAAEATVSSIRNGMGEATAAVHTSQIKMQQGMEKTMKTAEEFVAFGQGNVEAFVKSSQIWTAGAQDLSRQVAATAQSSFDDVMTTFKAMSSVKSLKDMFDLQANLARATLEKTMSESGKLTEASFKLTEQTLAPITARMTLAVEKLAKAG
jgi:phasin family protein